MLRGGLECNKSQFVFEGKEAVLISSLFKFFYNVGRRIVRQSNECMTGGIVL